MSEEIDTLSEEIDTLSEEIDTLSEEIYIVRVDEYFVKEILFREVGLSKEIVRLFIICCGFAFQV